MGILRRFGLSLAIFIFSSCISLLALFVAVYAVFETPTSLKAALQTSGIYLALPRTDSPSAVTSALPEKTDPGIQQAFANAFPPEFIQNSSEQAIDSIYNWLHGVTPTPDFSIDITSVKANFANNVATYLQQKLDSLPPCTGPLPQLPTSATDVANLTCRPPGITTTTLAEQARQEILASSLLSETTTINTSTFKDAEGKPLSDQLAFIPVLHQYYVTSLYVIPILIILCIIAIIFWSLDKRTGIKRIAWIFIGIGVTIATTSLVGVWLLQSGATLFGSADSMQVAFIAILKTLAIELSSWWVGFGIAYIILGIVALVILRFTKPEIREKSLRISGGHS